jgi:YVTN family beta-propeller protein
LPGPQLAATISYPPGIGIGPGGVAIGSRNGYVYVANEESNEISVVSGTQVITTMAVVSMPRFVHPDPVNGYVCVVDGNDGSTSGRGITIISGTAILTNVTYVASPVKTSFAASTVDPATGYAYFAFQGDRNQLLVWSRTAVLARLEVAPYPAQMAINPAIGYLYLSP